MELLVSSIRPWERNSWRVAGRKATGFVVRIRNPQPYGMRLATISFVDEQGMKTSHGRKEMVRVTSETALWEKVGQRIDLLENPGSLRCCE